VVRGAIRVLTKLFCNFKACGVRSMDPEQLGVERWQRCCGMQG